jgi:hypothetical protein
MGSLPSQYRSFSMTLAADPERFGAPSGSDVFVWSDQPHPQGLPVASQVWTVQVDWVQRPAAWSIVALSADAATSPIRIPALGIDVLIEPSAVWCAMGLDPARLQSHASLPLPFAVAGMRMHLQSFHITAAATFAGSDGLRATIL